MPTTRDTAELLALQRRIAEMSPADRLRLAADLVDVGKHDLAETLAGDAVDELRGQRIERNQGGRR